MKYMSTIATERKIYTRKDGILKHEERITDIPYRIGFVYRSICRIENEREFEKLDNVTRINSFIPIDDLIKEVNRYYLWSYDEIMQVVCQLEYMSIATLQCKFDNMDAEIIGVRTDRNIVRY